MSTVTEVQANIASKLLTTLADSVRADSQFADDLESITPGTTKFQLQAFVIGGSDAADGNNAFSYSILHYHHCVTKQHYLGFMACIDCAIGTKKW